MPIKVAILVATLCVFVFDAELPNRETSPSAYKPMGFIYLRKELNYEKNQLLHIKRNY